MTAITIVRIDQPHARNAVNSETAQRLHDEFIAFDQDPETLPRRSAEPGARWLSLYSHSMVPGGLLVTS